MFLFRAHFCRIKMGIKCVLMLFVMIFILKIKVIHRIFKGGPNLRQTLSCRKAQICFTREAFIVTHYTDINWNIYSSHHTSNSHWLHSDEYGSGQPSVVWVWFWETSPKNVKFFNFSLWVKKISLGRVKKYLGQRRVSILFTVGQK